MGAKAGAFAAGGISFFGFGIVLAITAISSPGLIGWLPLIVPSVLVVCIIMTGAGAIVGALGAKSRSLLKGTLIGASLFLLAGLLYTRLVSSSSIVRMCHLAAIVEQGISEGGWACAPPRFLRLTSLHSKPKWGRGRRSQNRFPETILLLKNRHWGQRRRELCYRSGEDDENI